MIGKYVKVSPRGYSPAVRKRMEDKHPDGNWKFDSVHSFPRGQKKISRAATKPKRLTVLCPHCGVKGWRPFKFLGRKIVSLDTGQQCRTVECWHCDRHFVLSVKCTKDCSDRLHCLQEGVAHPQPKVPVNDVTD